MNLKSMAAVAVASGVVTSIAAGDAVQWRVQDGGNGHWYRFNSSHASWTSARTAAIEQGGDLACITNADENAFVRDLIPAGDAGYLGGIRTPEGQTAPWHWVSGETWSYAKWNPGEPNGSTAGEVVWLERDSGGWNDHTQDWAIQGALLEWSADCNNDGLVDYGQCRDGSLPDFNGNNIPDCCEQGAACLVGNYPVQWRVQDGGNGHWYGLRPAACWSLAQSAAQSEGGHLATLTSAGERQFVGALVPSSDNTFTVIIGGSRVPESSMFTGWTWVTGEPFAYSAAEWMGGNPGCCAPDEYFLCVNRQGLLGDTAQCDTSRVVFEWSADCNNDGLVDYGQILRGELADTNANGVPDICDPCIADIVQDGLVNGIDLAAVLNNWGTKGGVIDADVNNDGIVDGADLSIVLNGWGACP